MLFRGLCPSFHKPEGKSKDVMVNHRAILAIFKKFSFPKFKNSPCSLLSLRNLPQVMQEPARQHTPLTFNRGFVHDCVSLLVRRAYTARSIDRIKEPPFLLNAEMYLNQVNTIVLGSKYFFSETKFFSSNFFSHTTAVTRSPKLFSIIF